MRSSSSFMMLLLLWVVWWVFVWVVGQFCSCARARSAGGGPVGGRRSPRALAAGCPPTPTANSALSVAGSRGIGARAIATGGPRRSSRARALERRGGRSWRKNQNRRSLSLPLSLSLSRAPRSCANGLGGIAPDQSARAGGRMVRSNGARARAQEHDAIENRARESLAPSTKKEGLCLSVSRARPLRARAFACAGLGASSARGLTACSPWFLPCSLSCAGGARA